MMVSTDLQTHMGVNPSALSAALRNSRPIAGHEVSYAEQ